MKIAIHHRSRGFSSKWIEYCQRNHIQYKIVNCYSNDIIRQVEDCDAVMWHFYQENPKDLLFAKELMYSLETSGRKVFPNFHTAWHFDDKVGQKYLLETIGAPLVPTYISYDKQEALQWAGETEFPKVFKLRSGAGSINVKLVKNNSEARRLIKKAFSTGFSRYNKWANLKERWYQYKKGSTGLESVIKGIFRFAAPGELARLAGHEKGYVYFQDFIPGNSYDIRVIVIAGKAFAVKRLARDGDFRASGSGSILYEKAHFNECIIRLSLDITDGMKSQCLAFDYIFSDGQPLITEVSYGFRKEPYYLCEGFWDRDLNWHPGPFDAQGWMVESLVS